MVMRMGMMIMMIMMMAYTQNTYGGFTYTYILRIFVIIIIIMLGLMVCEAHCNGNVDADDDLNVTLVSDGGGGDEDDDEIIRCGNDGYSAVREMDGDPEEARRMIDSRLGALHSEVIVILPTLITEMRRSHVSGAAPLPWHIPCSILSCLDPCLRVLTD